MRNFKTFREVALVLIGGGLIIYGIYTHPERLMPKPVDNSKPVMLP